jgi:hypothetical protein
MGIRHRGSVVQVRAYLWILGVRSVHHHDAAVLLKCIVIRPSLASVRRSRKSGSHQTPHYWSTVQFAAFLAAIIVLALILAGLLALVIELR